MRAFDEPLLPFVLENASLRSLTEATLALPRDPIAADLKAIEAASHHLLSRINCVLDISKIEAGRMELQEVTFDLASLIAEVAGIIRGLATARRVRSGSA